MVNRFELTWKVIVSLDSQGGKNKEKVVIFEDDNGNPFHTRRQAKYYALVDLDLDDVTIRPVLRFKV